MAQLLRKFVNTSAFRRGLEIVEHFDKPTSQIISVFTYHRVDTPNAQPDLAPSILSASPQAFEEQMRYLAERCNPISIHTLIDHLECGTPLPEKAVMVTFDDGYRDFAENAWGILRKFGIPVVLFVPTAYPSNPNKILWWDKLYSTLHRTTLTAADLPIGIIDLSSDKARKRAFKDLRNYVKSLPHTEAMLFVDDFCTICEVESRNDNCILDWNSLEQLAREGVTLAPHTRTHPMLTHISLDEVEQEALGSLHDLQQHIAHVLPIIAYPSGGADEDVADRMKSAGFILGFTQNRGINDTSEANRLLFKRINVGLNTSVNMMHAQMLRPILRLTSAFG